MSIGIGAKKILMLVFQVPRTHTNEIHKYTCTYNCETTKSMLYLCAHCSYMNTDIYIYVFGVEDDG
jgi:hypothetical protein